MRKNIINNKIIAGISSTQNDAKVTLVGVKDKPGVLSQITKHLAKYKISVQRLIQIPDNAKKKASIIIITHSVKENNSKKCLRSINSIKNIIKKPVLIRLF